MKPELNGVEEIVNYLLELNPDMDEDFIREYFESSGTLYQPKAILKTVLISDLIASDEDGNLENEKKQKRFNKLKTEAPPILIENNQIIDGHHRVRSYSNRGLHEILAYEIVSNE